MGVAHVGVSMQSIERWEVNYPVHGCVNFSNPPGDVLGCPRLLTGNMIDAAFNGYFTKILVFFLARLRNGLLPTMTSPSRLWLCI